MDRKIYFAGSIRGGRDDQEIYLAVIEELGKYGTVLTEHLGSKELGIQGEHTNTDALIFERDMDWVREANVIVAEVSTPSLGVGYELGQAEAMGKQILCLYRPSEGKRLSAMVAGNDYVQVEEYHTLADVIELFSGYFNS